MREHTERWMQLCAKAAVEQDPQKLMELVSEMLELLDANEKRLGILPPEPDLKEP